MFASLRRVLADLRAAVASVDPALVRAEDAVALLDLVVQAERACAAARTMLGARAVRANIWKREGHRSEASWLASKAGVTVGRAIGSIETGRRLEQLPETRAAFYAGRLSEQQVEEIASAAAACPEAEPRLLDAARTETLATLREEARRVRAAATTDEVGAYERIRRRRYFRHWLDPDGAVRLDARLTPDAGATVIAAVDARKDQIFNEARQAGLREPYEAYAADALVRVAEDASRSAGGRGPRATVHVMVDHSALARGRTTSEETCEIPGIGPIPVATARALANDAILKVIVTDGADIKAVGHAGRTIPARVRTALEARDRRCVVPACDVRRHLEIDHIVPLAEGGPTRLTNLARLCRWHHYLKTHCGHRLRGGPGTWVWETPDDVEGTPVGDARPPPAA
ncbi:MAG: DUF222 domain-containing protein [Actinomycetota bacterium]